MRSTFSHVAFVAVLSLILRAAWDVGPEVLEAAELTWLGSPAANAWLTNIRVSNDGKTVAGTWYDTSAFDWRAWRNESARWTDTKGWEALDFGVAYGQKLTVLASGSLADMSADGAIIVGTNVSGVNHDPFGNQEVQTFPSVNGQLPAGWAADQQGSLSRISADGSYLLINGQRWSLAEQKFVEGTGAVGISGDGAYLAGQQGSDMTRWSQAAGSRVLGEGTPLDMSTDGGAVVGVDVDSQVLRWTEPTGLVPLGVQVHLSPATTVGISSDGRYLFGTLAGAEPNTAAGPFLWDPLHGVRPLSAALAADFGLSTALDGVVLDSLDDVSASGHFLVGRGHAVDDPTPSVWRLEIDTWPTIHSLPGDANSDGAVDLADFGALKANFGNGHFWYQGDFTADSRIDLSDFGLLKANFGRSAAAVPEPATVVLAVLGLALALLAQRRVLGCTAVLRSARNSRPLARRPAF